MVPEMEIELKLCPDFLTFSYRPLSSCYILFSGTAAAPMDKKKFCSYPSLILSSGSLEADILINRVATYVHCTVVAFQGSEQDRTLGT